MILMKFISSFPAFHMWASLDLSHWSLKQPAPPSPQPPQLPAWHAAAAYREDSSSEEACRPRSRHGKIVGHVHETQQKASKSHVVDTKPNALL